MGSLFRPKMPPLPPVQPLPEPPSAELSQEEKDFCTKKIEERLEKTLEEWETKQKYRFLQSKPGIIFLSGIFVIIYIIFRLIRYF